jgi:hypothetical protein
MSTSQIQSQISSLPILQEAYPRQLLIPLAEAAGWLGISIGTARNWVSAGTLPIPTKKLGDLRQVDIRDLAAYLDGSFAPQSFTPTSELVTELANKRGRGRPKKMHGACTLATTARQATGG